MNLPVITAVDPFDEELHRLIGRLDAELLERYPAEGIFGVDFSDPKVRAMTFCVASLGGRSVGCGALRPLDGTAAELKRFYVDKACRGRGIASALVRHIEGLARAQGFMTMRLETGPRQPEAIGLYAKLGYRHIEAFGEYAGCEYSYCMEKRL